MPKNWKIQSRCVETGRDNYVPEVGPIVIQHANGKLYFVDSVDVSGGRLLWLNCYRINGQDIRLDLLVSPLELTKGKNGAGYCVDSTLHYWIEQENNYDDGPDPVV